MDPECQAQLLQIRPELKERFRQLNFFYKPSEACAIFGAAVKLCCADLREWGFQVQECRLAAPDGRVLWPK